MKNVKPLKILWILCLVMLLVASPRIFAQDELDDFGGLDDAGGAPAEVAGTSDSTVAGEAAPGTEAKTQRPEKEIIDDLAALPECAFKGGNPDKDPFKPIVKKKVILPPVRRRVRPRTHRSFKPKAPPIKPIKLFVSGIVGNDGNRLALVKFEGKDETIWKDKVVKGKFKVVDVLSDRVVVYSNKEQRRHTFKIGGPGKRRR